MINILRKFIATKIYLLKMIFYLSTFDRANIHYKNYNGFVKLYTTFKQSTKYPNEMSE